MRRIFSFLLYSLVLGLTFGGIAWKGLAQQNPAGLVIPSTAKVKDTFTPLLPHEVALQGGMIGTRVEASEKSRLLVVDENDLMDAFERRLIPHQDWQGEHVGKFLHAATQAWAYTRDNELKAKLDRVVARLLKTQEPDGYLGTYKPDHRWTSWDVWVHKYDLLGLLTYYQYTHNLPHDGPKETLSDQALMACRRVGDLLINTFGTEPGKRDINKSGEHVGMAPDSVLEAVVLLYRATEDPRYLQFAEYIVANYDAPGGPRVVSSLEQYKSVRRVANAKAYEMISNFNGLLELYRTTGERRLLEAMRVGWEDIVKNQLYLTGSASAGEHFQDDFHLPNGMRANICETCVTVTWEQMNLELLRLTGEARFADQLERSVYNHLLGAQKPTGDQWAYYTPLEGRKPYGSSTNCCLSSGPRGVALIPSIAYMTSNDGGLVVNFYNTGTATAQTKAGRVTITQKTDYPLEGTVVFILNPDKNGAKFPLRLRIPDWTPSISVAINGKKQPLNVKLRTPQYLTLDRAWKKGDTVTLTLGMPTRLILGDHENEGKAAILYGPLVLALDTALNPELSHPNRAELTIGDSKLLSSVIRGRFTLKPAMNRAKSGEMVFETEGRIAGETKTIPLYLTPFATAGQDGKSQFAVWIALLEHASAAKASGSLFDGAKQSYSRVGNVDGDIADSDLDTFRVTFNARKSDEDWFAVTRSEPAMISRVVYAHGKAFHDGGWFDASGGKPRIQAQTEKGGPWKTIAVLDAYPSTTATDSAGLKEGQKFEVRFAPVQAVAIRIVGKPACGDNPMQAFTSCAELQAFEK